MLPLKKEQMLGIAIQGVGGLRLSNRMYLALQRVSCRSLAYPFDRSALEFSESRIPPASRKRARKPTGELVPEQPSSTPTRK